MNMFYNISLYETGETRSRKPTWQDFLLLPLLTLLTALLLTSRQRSTVDLMTIRAQNRMNSRTGIIQGSFDTVARHTKSTFDRRMVVMVVLVWHGD